MTAEEKQIARFARDDKHEEWLVMTGVKIDS